MNNAAESVSRITARSPTEMRDLLVRLELRRAGVWFGLAMALALVVLLIQPLLIIFTLPPALTLGMRIIASALFGILALALAERGRR